MSESLPEHYGGETAALLADLRQFVRRFVVLSESEVIVLSLFIMETHVFDQFVCAPYLHVTSAEKQSGKSRLLEVLELLVSNPWLTSRTSAAALTRKVHADRPTLLLDESDAAFGGDREYAEALRGLLNAGHRKGGKASICVRKGAEIEVVDLDVFGPKVIAGIGSLPDTIADRSIPIRMKRKRSDEHAERFRRRLIEDEALQLRDRIMIWANSTGAGALSLIMPELPEELSDRQQDISEPLLAIADGAGAECGKQARAALLDLLGCRTAVDDSTGVQLLSDIRDVFGDTQLDRISSKVLVGKLVAIEGAPWVDINHGQPLTPTTLARHLRGFRIESRNQRERDKVPKGYSREAFEDAWARYLRPLLEQTINSAATPLQPASVQGKPATVYPLHDTFVADQDTDCELFEI